METKRVIINLSDLSGRNNPTFIISYEVNMEKILENLKSELQGAFASTEIIVDEVTYEKKGKYNFLTVVLDRIGGLDLETIVEATKVVNEVVDRLDITDDSYILDCISKERG